MAEGASTEAKQKRLAALMAKMAAIEKMLGEDNCERPQPEHKAAGRRRSLKPAVAGTRDSCRATQSCDSSQQPQQPQPQEHRPAPQPTTSFRRRRRQKELARIGSAYQDRYSIDPDALELLGANQQAEAADSERVCRDEDWSLGPTANFLDAWHMSDVAQQISGEGMLAKRTAGGTHRGASQPRDRDETSDFARNQSELLALRKLDEAADRLSRNFGRTSMAVARRRAAAATSEAGETDGDVSRLVYPYYGQDVEESGVVDNRHSVLRAAMAGRRSGAYTTPSGRAGGPGGLEDFRANALTLWKTYNRELLKAVPPRLPPASDTSYVSLTLLAHF